MLLWHADLTIVNSLLFGVPACDINRLLSAQSAAAQLFGGISRRDNGTPVLRDNLHWLPVSQRISFKMAVLVYKSLN